MRIAVLGAGAIGSVFGGFLAKAGHEVCLLGREAHVTAVRQRGLTVEGIWGNHVIEDLHAFSSIEGLKGYKTFDLALLAVKSYDTLEVLEGFCEIVKTIPPVVSLQNGLGNLEHIVLKAGTPKTIGARVIFGVEYLEPGRVRVTVAADKTLIGTLPGAGDTGKLVRDIAREFTSAGIPTECTEHILVEIWGKVLYNCSLNGLATLLDCTYGKLLESCHTRNILSEIIKEIFDVTTAVNIPLAWDSPHIYERCLFTDLIPKTKDHHPSMLQDIHRGKKTEIDALNGAVTMLGTRCGLEVPYNRSITRLIHARESICPIVDETKTR